MLPGAAQRHSPPAVLPVAYLIPSEPLSRYMSASVPFLEFVACRRVEKIRLLLLWIQLIFISPNVPTRV
jgi:hypothetical protein